MAQGDTIITVVGRLTADPELRFTPSGAPVANFTIATNPRFFDRQSNEWKDGEALFVRCAVWREQAENAAGSLTKGTRVIAQGALKAKSYTDKQGNDRTSWELDVEDIGPSLRFATAQTQRAGKSTTGFGGGNANTYDATRPQSTPSSDPWGPQPSPNAGGWPTDEPAF